MGTLPGDKKGRSKSTVNICIKNIIDFIELLIEENPGKCNIKHNELFKEIKSYNLKKKKLELKKVPTFDIRYTSTPKEIFRDMPESVFSILMSVVIQKHKDLLMLISLGAFAGMRPSECCNVRRNDSKLGAGIRFQIVNGEIEDIIIDLTKEINLRSDLISVGKIKKERTQRVYPAFHKVFYDCYQIYMDFIEGNKYESDFGALTTNKQGKAITYDKDLIPELLDSNDPEAVNYGYLLQERNITPHIFRHWFSVKLTLFGEDISGLMYWRGDKSPESALIYLQNKGDLVKQYAKVNNEIFDYSMWKVSKLKND
jgi:integrase